MNHAPRRPNFFIVGAPKCGTTSLYEYIRQHPEVYMPYSKERYWQYKEPYFFCEELISWPGLRIQDEASYLSMFEPAGDAKCLGEATALYLYSEHAASRIKAFSPDAKIIIMLRNPVDMMKAWHHDCVRWGHENIVDFELAVRLEEQRKHRKQLPPGSGYPQCLLYSKIATFEPQIKRFFDIFGQDSIKILLLDDLDKQPLKTYANVANFLGIDPSYVPSIKKYNQRQAVTDSDMAVAKMKGFFRSHAAWARHVKPFIPSAFKSLLRNRLKKMETPIEMPMIDPVFLANLRWKMEPTIDKLGLLIDRDLSHWKEMTEVELSHPVCLAA